MTLQLALAPDVERGLLAQAQRQGLSLQEYFERMVAREAHRPAAAEGREAATLVDLSESVRGLLSDEEVNTLFRRTPSMSWPIDPT